MSGRSQEETTKLIEDLGDEQRKQILFDLCDTLYGVGSKRDWGADQLGFVANLLEGYGLALPDDDEEDEYEDDGNGGDDPLEDDDLDGPEADDNA